MVSWIEERECEGVNGREREAARVLARVGTHGLTSGTKGSDVATKFCACDTHKRRRAHCPRRTCGLSVS
jgi:hypothetical protein